MVARSKKTYRKKSNKYRKRKTYKKKLGFNRTLVPKSYPCKLRFVDYASYVNPTAGSPGVYVYRANSIFDPDLTGTGNKPRGTDQLQPMYNHFVVVSSKITVHFMTPYEEATNSNSIMGISVRGASSHFADLTDYMENRNTCYKVCSHTPETPNSRTVTKTFSAKKFLGRSHPLSDPELKGGPATNPTEAAYFHVWVGEASDSVNPDPMRLVVQIDYNVIFIEPKTPPQS